jgi:aspartate/methionine/tyrosine aminotransferase
MRTNIINRGIDELTYEIRGIVAVGEELKKLGVPIYWENIGDPVAKGAQITPWIKEIVTNHVRDNDSSYGYSPTRGVLATREFIAQERNHEGGAQITPNDILFYNGLGDAIANVYTYLNQGARVIGPNPAYPTHSSAEGAHAKTKHITYSLNPHRNWLPDIEDIRNKVRYNPTVAGILIINPDNPTGMVYPRRVLEEIISIAREYDLFVIADEIYANIVYGDEAFVSLASIIGDVPGIAMRGLSKEVPWPGSRCGWVEFYNTKKDPMFERYAKALVDAKMLEVCSTTLPQTVLPEIFSHNKYASHITTLADEYRKKADFAYNTLRRVRGVTAPKPAGAFYGAVVFDEDILRDDQTLPIESNEVRMYIEKAVQGLPRDKRFVYYLMASTGICVVPLSGMNSELEGFRFTLLEPNKERFEHMINTVATSIKQYLAS